MMVFGDCKICGSTPINDATDLCEHCEEQARLDGEMKDEGEEWEPGEWEAEQASNERAKWPKGGPL